MVHEAKTVGLNVQEPTLGTLDYMADIAPTHEEFLFGIYKWFSCAVVRPITRLIAHEKNLQYRNQDCDPSVAKRLAKDKSYHPKHEGLRRLAGTV
jgi:hypothetical protein